MSCARSSRRRTRYYHVGSDLAAGLAGPNWLDVAAWVPTARAFIEGHCTLTMEVQAMIHIRTCVVAAAALWRSGRIADPRMCNTGLTRSNRSNKLRVPQGRCDSSPSTPIMPTADARPSTQAGVRQCRGLREVVERIAVKDCRAQPRPRTPRARSGGRGPAQPGSLAR